MFNEAKTEPKMTKETIRKILEAIAECDRYIALEGKRSADLRPADVAKTLAFYHQHRANLIARLQAN